MRIIAVDDEPLGLKTLEKAISKADPQAEIICFGSAKEALKYAGENDIDIAFLDIQMPEMLGTELARKIKMIKPAVNVIFATGYDSYMGDAFSLHANGYVLKPVTAAKVRKELDNINTLSEAYVQKAAQSNKKIRFQCFGNFEAFCGSNIIHFKYDKTKEVLAYLVSRRGALCSNGEIIANIFEDDMNHESYLRGLRKDLVDTFQNLDAGDIIVGQRGKMGISSDRVNCDYYDFLNNDASAINSYRGEFMAQYSWAEFINAGLWFQS